MRLYIMYISLETAVTLLLLNVRVKLPVREGS